MIKIKFKNNEDYKELKKVLQEKEIPCYIKKKTIKPKKDEELDTAEKKPKKEIRKTLIIDDDGFYSPVNRILSELEKAGNIGEYKLKRKGCNIIPIEADIPHEDETPIDIIDFEID